MSQESRAWLLGCIIVPLALWAFLATLLPAPPGLTRPGRRRKGEARRSGDERRSTDREDEDWDRRETSDRRGPPAWSAWLGVAVTSLSLFFRPGFLRGQSPWGSFGLTGEEGVYLGAVQAMRTGRPLYSELEFPYGPLLIQPLSWWMHLFQDSVVSARFYACFLSALGLLAAAVCLRLLVGPGRGAWWGLMAALVLALVAPLFLPTLNSTLLRTVLPFLPAALVLGGARRQTYRATEESVADSYEDLWRCPFVAAGLCAGVALFFSFDTGAAALGGLALAVYLVGGSSPVLGRVGLSLACLVALVSTHLLLQGNFEAFLEQGWRMVTLPALGYQALPYPDTFGLFVDGAGQTGAYPPMNPATEAWSNPTALWSVLPPLLIWLGLGLGLRAPRVMETATRNASLLCTAFIAALLFRAALGRSDLYHLWFYGAVPTVFISLLILERAWELTKRELRPLLAIGGVLAVIALISTDSEEEVRFPDEEEARLGELAKVDRPLEPREVEIGRSGRMQLLPRLAGQMEVLVTRTEELPEEDGVYFYPSEAAYYFLTDRPVPVRYLWAYDAGTPEMQVLAIEDLEESQPKWLFRSTDTFAIDHIPQTHLVPRIDTYLKDHYRLVEVLPGATLHERIER